jgi:demethylmenaquinone methyltransferase / 2-methoxy-6-polyprenyl-1,4-benzoquinol methylase
LERGVTRAGLNKRADEVATMFDDVAARYDLTNDVLSLGQDRWWRRVVTRTVAAQPGERVLDIAAGTGTSSEPFRAAGAHVVPCDFSLGMLRVGRDRRPDLPFVAGDALALPFRDGAFDAVTISFGLRNVADVDQALREMLRVTRDGGRLVVCEFSLPSQPVLGSAYNQWLQLLPRIARRVATNPEAYVYLAESIRAWPAPAALAQRVGAAGWSQVGWHSLTAGIVTLHTARKTPAPAA